MLNFSYIVVLLVLLHYSLAGKVSKNTFEKPFESISSDGVRLVGDDWVQGGSVVVNKHFARITPDRQSKRGYIWNKNRLNMDEFSVLMEFRISGQAAHWYGDGIALWITTEPNHVDGDNHGFLEQFHGIGIIFDTFHNTEHEGGHKDVTIFLNDGTKKLDDLNYQQKIGCDMPNIRYHEKNAAFSASKNFTRAKIQFKNRYMTIHMDADGTGNWLNCYEGDINIPGFYPRDATLGLTSSTGSLADNHDVLSLVVYDKVEDIEHKKADEKSAKKVEKAVPVDSINGTASDRVEQLLKQFNQLQEDFEHQIHDLKERTDNTISKLRNQEEKDFKRIEELERVIAGKVDQKLQSKMNVFHDSVDTKLEKTVKETITKGSTWKTPFFLLVVAIGLAMAFAYRKYQELRKSHLL